LLKNIIIFAVCFILACASNKTGKFWPPQNKPNYKVQLETPKGTIVIDVYSEWAPVASERFVELVKASFYNGCRFYRVVKNFMAQTGINGDPTVTVRWENKTIMDDPPKVKNYKYTVCMARSGQPNSASTQFFINLNNNFYLDKYGYAPFGVVSNGATIIDSLFSGYGECSPMGQGPNQNELMKEGNSYLNNNFSKLDWIEKVTFIEENQAK
jgi:cyclophilin family peptidyl-prolyl cis-trans isomerase